MMHLMDDPMSKELLDIRSSANASFYTLSIVATSTTEN